MKSTTPKICKILFLLSALLSLNICSSQPTVSDRTSEFKAGVCAHKFCTAKRLEQNTSAAVRHEFDVKSFAQRLDKYEQNKGTYRGLITIGSVISGLAAVVLVGYNSPKGIKLGHGLLSGLAGFSVPLILGLILHRLNKPGEPVLCLTTECFIASAITTMQKYRSQTKFDALWWQSLDALNMSIQIRTKFSDRAYPFQAALDACADLLEDLNRAELAAVKLQEASSFDGFNSEVTVSTSELYSLREAHAKIFILKSNIQSSYELATEKKLKQQEEEKLAAQRQAEIERCRRHMAENDAEYQRQKAQNSEFQMAQAEKAKIRESHKQEQRAATKKSDLDPQVQQRELDYWKNKQKTDQQKKLDHYNAQKAQNDAQATEENRRKLEAQIAKDLNQRHEEHLRQKAAAQAAAAEHERAERQRIEAAQAQARLAQKPVSPTPSQPAESEERIFGAEECGFCLSEPPRNPKRLKDCGHVFCSDCGANDWIKKEKNCPTCRTPVK